MKEKIEALKQYINQLQPADGETVMKMLYEYNSEHQTYDNEQIRADFHALYEQMHGMPLKEIDNVIYAVCVLCRVISWQGLRRASRLASVWQTRSVSEK